jgi:hypothetical protein
MLMRDTIGTTNGFDSSTDQSLPAFVSMSAKSADALIEILRNSALWSITG